MKDGNKLREEADKMMAKEGITCAYNWILYQLRDTLVVQLDNKQSLEATVNK